MGNGRADGVGRMGRLCGRIVLSVRRGYLSARAVRGYYERGIRGATCQDEAVRSGNSSEVRDGRN
nr:hypothetical protein [Brevibacillus laterosporus]